MFLRVDCAPLAQKILGKNNIPQYAKAEVNLQKEIFTTTKKFPFIFLFHGFLELLTFADEGKVKPDAEIC